MGQSIRLDVSGARAIRQGEVKPIKEKGPMSLSRAKVLSCPEVLQVSMIRPDEEWHSAALKEVTPFLEGQF